MTLMMEGFTDSINICNRAKFFSLFKCNDIAAREASVHDGAHSLTQAICISNFLRNEFHFENEDLIRSAN